LRNFFQDNPGLWEIFSSMPREDFWLYLGEGTPVEKDVRKVQSAGEGAAARLVRHPFLWTLLDSGIPG